MSPGEAVQSILDVIGMSQTDLARRADISLKHVNQIINGRAVLHADVAVALADAIAEHLIALEAREQIRKARLRRTSKRADDGM